MREPSLLFPAGVVVPPEDLVGRWPTVERWMRWLEGGQSLYVIGPRRTGKTSVAMEVLRRLAAGRYATAFVDCLACDTVASFSETLADRVLEAETGVRGTLRRVREFFRGLRPTAEVTDRGIELSLALGADRDEPPTLQAALGLAEEVARHQGRRFVVCIDEFQAAGDWSRSFYRICRSVIQHQRSVSYLFLGSQAHAMRNIFTKANEPFHGFAQAERLDPVDDEEWLRYLRDRYAQMGLAADDLALRALLERTGAHPYETMRVANLVADLHGERREPISHAEVLLAYHRTLADLGDLWEERWREAARVPHAQSVLFALAEGRGPYSGKRDKASGVAKAIRYLEDQGWIVRTASGRRDFFEPMFRDYVRGLRRADA